MTAMTAMTNDFSTILFDEAPVGLGLSDMTGKLVKYNKMLLKLSGFSAEDIDAFSNVTNLYYNPEDRQTVLNKTLKDGFLENYPVKFKKKDGSYFESLLSLSPVTYNKTPHFLAMIQDVSKQAQDERELSQKVTELEKMNRMMIGRELRMKELKDANEALNLKLQELTGKTV